MTIDVAVNGLGRIGRLAVRHVVNSSDANLVGLNDTSELEEAKYLMNYDTIHGEPEFTVRADGTNLLIDGEEVAYSNHRDPSKINWKAPDVTLECTGSFRDPAQALKHRDNGSSKVIISAPSKGGKADDCPSLVYGVNQDSYDGENVIDAASCSTNALANMLDPINNEFGIKYGMANTIHAYTGSQNLVDGSNRKPTRRRAAAENIVPTTTGAASAIFDIIPELEGKLDAVATRVPVPNGSIIDLNVSLEQEVTVQKVHRIFEDYEQQRSVLGTSEDPLVSSDIVSTTESVILDKSQTRRNSDMIKIMGWYDNEYAYAKRMLDLARLMR